MQTVMENYFEFPALFDICHSRDSSKLNRSCMSFSQAEHFWEHDLESHSPMTEIDFLTFFPPYVKLFRAPSNNDTYERLRDSTTPIKLKGKSITSAGGLDADNVYNISLS